MAMIVVALPAERQELLIGYDYAMEEETFSWENAEEERVGTRCASLNEEYIEGIFDKISKEDEQVLLKKWHSCAICLEDFTSSDMEIRRTPCSHVHHHECIIEWLGRNRMCPLCRCQII